MKVVARRIQIEEPSRLIIQRKLPEEVLQIEMLKHTARVDGLALEMFHSSVVPAIYILFEDSSSESTCALSIRTCAESPAMLTKQSHVTAEHVVAACTQVILHTDNSRVIDRLRKIVVINGYEERGERPTTCKVPQLRVMATAAKATTASNRVTVKMTTTSLSAGRQPYEIGRGILWRQGTGSTDTELDGSEVRFDFEMFYLCLRYSREASCLRRTATAIRETTTMLSTDRRPREDRTAIQWEWGTTSADIEEAGYLRRTMTVIQGAMTTYEESQRTIKKKICDAVRPSYYEWGGRAGRSDKAPDEAFHAVAQRMRQHLSDLNTTLLGFDIDGWRTEARKVPQQGDSRRILSAALDSSRFCLYFVLFCSQLRSSRVRNNYGQGGSHFEVRRKYERLQVVTGAPNEGKSSVVQVLHVNRTQDTERICKIGTVEGYDEWGEQVQYPREGALMSQCEIEEEKELFEGEGEEEEQHLLATMAVVRMATTKPDVDRSCTMLEQPFDG
ncbi:hypothetical protein M404DRAFT_20528 [Pisolithus tinctorius Marx 270]|uniref:Uncharacterized protein n=1 Tax=Pisolithus tinctorius Marx 270 TaxID=870435 RepID=A0A0C3PR13_PISTI|nr:hypothetical protein M404DRAFT_20528 [Pisolithus tinctorius Marx 270]